MHELGVLVHILRTVREAALENGITKVDRICLDVGEICGVVPEYLKLQLPIAVHDQPMFADCDLEIRITEASGKCLRCSEIYPLKKHEGICPHCGYDDFYTVEGTELMIREITAS